MSEANQSPLCVQSLRKSYDAAVAVDDVSLEVRSGQCFGLLGPNGAGKTTLIRSVMGRVKPDSGTISVFGHTAGTADAQACLGWVTQELALYPLLNCRENLQTFGLYYGLRGAALKQAIEWCLQWAGLHDRAKSPVKTLSGGMKRRLNLVAGLIHKPKLVVLDEPTVGVDPQSRNCIFEMVESLRAAGTTLIYTTHYMEEAERLCDEIAIIDHGHIIAQGSKEQLVSQSFGATNAVRIHYAAEENAAVAWAREQGGKADAGIAHFKIERPQQIAQLLETAARANILIEDLQLTRPNLESVFLHLTGKELRA
jgi:ABC-2 type transport system ATP-binding protein